MSIGAIVGTCIGGVIGLILLIFALVVLIMLPKKAFFTCWFSGCAVSAFRLIGLKLRGFDVNEIMLASLLAKKSHVGVPVRDLEVLFASGGHPQSVVRALVAAKSANLPLDFAFLQAADIAGYDVLQVVQQCVNTKVIEIPLVNAAAGDNKEVNVKISLTLKVNIQNFLSGVGEETISARAVEAVVTKIANTAFAAEVVSRPQILDQAIFAANVDEDSKYELVSADVIDVDYGADRALAMEKEQIEKNHILQVNALEHRRLAAVAQEAEMKAKTEENKAEVAANEAEIPKAVVKAIEEGKIKDVLDFYKLQNLQADTEMRRHMTGRKDEDPRF